MDEQSNKSAEKLEQAADRAGETKYTLRLYIAGLTPRSKRAIENIQRICEEELKGRYELEIVDVYQQPEIAATQQIIAAPTLIKTLPLPLRRVIGDLSDTERVIVGLDLRPKNKSD
jgi:circadian clock protein KaiB